MATSRKLYQIMCITAVLGSAVPGTLRSAEIPGVGARLAVSSSKPKLAATDDEPEDVFPRVAYKGGLENGVLGIGPKLLVGEAGTDYLALLKAGGPIEPPTFGSPEYNLFFPALDVRVVNNSKESLHISRVDLKVARSTPDPTPLPMVFGGYDEVQHIKLFNEGWGRIEKADFEFDLVASEPKGKPKGPLPFKRVLHRVANRAVLGLHDELEKKGVSPALVAAARGYRECETRIQALESDSADWEALERDKDYKALVDRKDKLSKMLFDMAEKGGGPFWKGRDDSGLPVLRCWLHGWMTASWLEGAESREMKVAVICEVLVIPPDGLGAPCPVTGTYEAMLSRKGADYTLQVPVSHMVKPGGVARFDLTLGLPETGRHEFAVVLTTVDGKAIDAGRVVLSGLLPRSAEASLKSIAGKPAE